MTFPEYLGADGGKVTVTRDGAIATVAFHHPRGNSLPGALLRALAAAITAAGKDAETRVIVLRSEGTGPWCAGASFDELTAITNATQGKEFFSGFSGVIMAMTQVPQFVIARIHGKTAGGGVGLTAAADYAICVEKAAFRLSELAVGIGPFVVGPVIEKKIGTGAYAAMTVDVEWRDAAWAERHGLVAKVVADDAALDAAVSALANTLATSNPEAMAELKRVFWAGTERWPELLADRAAASGRLVLSDFTRAAIAKFKSKG
jgi:methylglutaconyl-CoA hydratase